MRRPPRSARNQERRRHYGSWPRIGVTHLFGTKIQANVGHGSGMHLTSSETESLARSTVSGLPSLSRSYSMVSTRPAVLVVVVQDLVDTAVVVGVAVHGLRAVTGMMDRC